MKLNPAFSPSTFPQERHVASLTSLYRYGGHIELIGFKEYYGMPRGHEHDPIY